MKASEKLRYAAERSLIHGDGLCFLPRSWSDRWFDVFKGNGFIDKRDFCPSLCFAAAIAESEGN